MITRKQYKEAMILRGFGLKYKDIASRLGVCPAVIYDYIILGYPKDREDKLSCVLQTLQYMNQGLSCAQAARKIGINRNTLYKRLRRYNDGEFDIKISLDYQYCRGANGVTRCFTCKRWLPKTIKGVWVITPDIGMNAVANDVLDCSNYDKE